MTGQDFQDKLDAIVVDLQTKGKGQTVQILLRSADNSSNVFPLSSNQSGVVDIQQLQTVQTFINNMKPTADAYETERAPVSAAYESFKTASAPHQGLADAASLARKAYSDATAADPTFQAAKNALDSIRNDPDYIAAITSYADANVSENFGNLSDAKGKYVPAG